MLLVRKLKGAWRGQAFSWLGQFLGTVLSLQSEAVLWEAAGFKGHPPSHFLLVLGKEYHINNISQILLPLGALSDTALCYGYLLSLSKCFTFSNAQWTAQNGYCDLPFSPQSIKNHVGHHIVGTLLMISANTIECFQVLLIIITASDIGIIIMPILQRNTLRHSEFE